MRFLFAVLLIIVVSATAQDLSDELVGTWKLNPDKSTMRDEELLKISKIGPHQLRTEYISAGKTTRTIVHVCDGKEHDTQASRQTGDSETCALRTFDVLTRRSGREYMLIETRLSPDRKIMTRTRVVHEDDDKWFHDKLVYERQ
jgi:polyhydroxyalkanoate synthesis regulator phasin